MITIQPEKQDNRKNSWGGGWKWQESRGEEVEQNLKKECGVSNAGGLHKKGGLEPLCQLCKETKKFPSPIIKPNPLPPSNATPGLPPISSKNFPFLPLEPFLKNLIPTLYEGGVQIMFLR